MNKVAFLLLFFIVFIVGVSLGAYFAVSSEFDLVSEIVNKNSYDLILFIFTVISSVATTVATVFALCLYFSWKSQQAELELMGLRKNLLKNLISMEKIASRIFRSYQVRKAPKNKIELETELRGLCSEFRSDLLLFYTLQSKGKTKLGYKEVMTLSGDFLDSAKKLTSLCNQICTASSYGFIKSNLKEGSFTRELTLQSEFGTTTELEVLISRKDAVVVLPELLAEAALNISKENVKLSM